MKVTMLVNVGAYDEGQTYDLPDEMAKALVKDKLAK